ncbi:hypothetical protein [Polaribacter tangerinus]|uniref:hypothetical protein n=1 Tax=Polaribacter tangerinus TaxID=1920034 RepID=UPI000B4BF35F|nr:hypothetical protein [Polaribacter tangerinus]
MKNILLKYILCSLLIGSIIYFSALFKLNLPNFLRFYLNDFLIIPVVLYSSLQVLKWSKNNKSYKISTFIIIYICTLYSILFEFVFPEFLERYTKDYLDILLYYLGGAVFYKLQQIEGNSIHT